MDQITPLPSTAPEQRGAGGKLRKPPPRKPPASPYARPASNRRWISKLVDPAYRIIADGATRFLPSFFSATDSATNSPSSIEDDQGKLGTSEQHNEDNLLKSNLHLPQSELSKMASIGDGSSKQNSSFDFVLPRRVEKGEQHENYKLSDIEQLVKRTKFTRDEFNRMVEILNSREIDVSNVEEGKEHPNLTSRQDDGGLVAAHKLPKVFNERRQEESNAAIRGSSTPGMSKGQDEIGASPIEIARTFMGSRASEAGPSSKNMIQTVESTMLLTDEAAIKSYDPSPSKKSPTGWPGAFVQHAYTTPQSQGSKYGFLNHARTPYSKTLLPKSNSKLIHTQGNYSHISSTPLRHSQTSLYLKDKSEVGASESGYGSVGPIRRTRHKVGVQSTSQRPAYSSMCSSQRENSSFIECSTPTVATRMGLGGMSSSRKLLGFERSVPTVPMHTSLMAKKILEHIDRNIPTPKEKSAELKLATKLNNAESSVNTSTVFSNVDDGLVKLKDVSPSKYNEFGGMDSILRNEDEGNCNVDIQPRESTDKSVDITKEGTLTSDLNVHRSIPRLANDARTTQNFGSSQMFSAKSTDKDVLMALPSVGQYPLVNQEKKTVANNAASKPVLAPISIKKPESKWALASDNSSGFTFPVTATSSVFSEPPTPSIMPLLFSTSNQQQLEETSNQLSYSFGVKKSNPAVVFSFPSTSNTVDNDAGVIKYNFAGTTSFSSGSSNKYGGFGSSGDRFSDSYGDKGRYDEAKVDKDYSGKSRHGVSSKTEENSFKKGSARSVSKSQENKSSRASKSSANASAVPSQSASVPTEDDFDDFDPRGTSTKTSAGISNQVDLFGQDLLGDFMDAPTSVSVEKPATSDASEVDLFADASFVSAAPHADKGASSQPQDEVDLFSSQPAIPSVTPTVDLFSIPAPAVQPDSKSENSVPVNNSSFDPFASVPLNNFEGSDVFGDFTSQSDSVSSQPSTNAATDGSTSGKSVADSNVSPKKDAFQVKSGIWADSLSRGLIDLNISAPKKVSLVDVGIVGGLSDGLDEREKGPPTTLYMGRAMGTGSGLGMYGGTPSQSTAGDDIFSNFGSQNYQFGGFQK